MGNWAIKICKKLKYQGVATVEFLVDNDHNYYFMEVNPIIQVEHPITEAITGIDIVKQQIKIAQGEKLNISQKDVTFNGWAIETRINSENPAKNFQPTPGKIEKYIPSGGQGIFIHSFLHEGQEIYPYFDSLLVKIVAHGTDRKDAIKKLKRALDETVIEGVPSTIPFFKSVLTDRNFLNGKYFTNYVEKSEILKDLICSSRNNFCFSKINELTEEDVASIVFQIYQDIKEKKQTSTSKWLLANRIKMME
jgi:acetyl-CoA carboxylase biotin carboxylase subunit